MENKSARIRGACKQVINRHKQEMLDINQLLHHINDYGYKSLGGWVKSRLFERLDELEIAIESKSHTPWTSFEIKWIRDNYPNATARELAIDMNRSTASVKRMINKLMINKNGK